MSHTKVILMTLAILLLGEYYLLSNRIITLLPDTECYDGIVTDCTDTKNLRNCVITVNYGEDLNFILAKPVPIGMHVLVYVNTNLDMIKCDLQFNSLVALILFNIACIILLCYESRQLLNDVIRRKEV